MAGKTPYTGGFQWIAGLAALALAVAFSCARQGFPPGGPEDKAAPEVVNTIPASLATNVSGRESIVFEFSEPMAERSVEDNLFIVPIPENWPVATWREGGRVLILDFPDPLRDNATYIVTIGAKATDRRNNPLRDSIILTFSTGAEVEQGVIRGRVVPWTFFGPSPENAAGVDVAAYSLADSAAMPDPRDDVPDYVTQTGADGSFTLVGVSSGTYRLFAIGDRDRNGFYSPGEDMIGIAPHAVRLARGDTLAIAPQMVVSEMDTALVQLTSMRPPDRRRVEFVFDSPLDPATVEFTIGDLAVAGWFIPTSDSKRISVATGEQQAGKTYPVNGLSVRDRDGNPLAPPDQPMTFTGSDRPDTTALEILSWEPKLLTPGNRPVLLTFNRVLVLPESLQSVIADASGEAVTVSRAGSNRLEIRPGDRWKSATAYLLTFNRETLRGVAGNALTGPGSQLAFRVAPTDTLGFIAGTVVDAGGTGESLYRLRFNNIDTGVMETVEVTGQQPWRTGAVLPGRYIALGHRDDDRDGGISRGNMVPYRPAEPVYAVTDTFVVESEKTVNDVRFIFQ